MKTEILEAFCFAGPLTVATLFLALGMPHWSILMVLITCPVVHAILWVRESAKLDALLRRLDSGLEGSERG